MKKTTLLVGILALTNLSSVFAESCETLSIHIKNQSHADCVLNKSYLIHGKLSANHAIPEVIFRDQAAQFNITSSSIDELDVLLAYQCGDEQAVSFYTRKPESGSIRPQRNIPVYFFTVDNSTVVESQNMVAKFTSELCREGGFYSKQRPNTINWILYSSDGEAHE